MAIIGPEYNVDGFNIGVINLKCQEYTFDGWVVVVGEGGIGFGIITVMPDGQQMTVDVFLQAIKYSSFDTP